MNREETGLWYTFEADNAGYTLEKKMKNKRIIKGICMWKRVSLHRVNTSLAALSFNTLNSVSIERNQHAHPNCWDLCGIEFPATISRYAKNDSGKKNTRSQLCV